MSEDLLQSSARLIVDYGLKDLGFQYVILDDCWSNGRDDNGTLVPDYTKFPNGMAAVADDIHDLGLKFGMYSSAGVYTCGQYAGSLGYEEIDAQTWASWGVDYLKCEWIAVIDILGSRLTSIKTTTAITPGRLVPNRSPTTVIMLWRRL